MGKLAQITWPQEYSELQRIEELLLCGICYDYMDTSVMTPCSHNYCSLCIRKYLHYKTQCPACFEKTFEKDLHTNRILDELILYFGKIRSKLVGCIAGAKIESNEESLPNSPRITPVRPARTNQNQKKTPIKAALKKNEISADNEIKTEEPLPLIGTPQKIVSSPSTSGVTKVAAIFTPKSKTANAASGPTLPCPVCNVEVREVNMNKHLDDCLKREATSLEPARTEKKRKPLPKLVFSLMKDTELRKKIKELGLPTQGDRKTLEARFQRYSTLYNAECDKKEPRPVVELLRQCDEEEAFEKKMSKSSQSANRLKINRNTETNVIEEAQKKYLESNKKNYQNLITSIKDREKTRKSVRRSLIKQEVDDASSETDEKLTELNNSNVPSDDEGINHTSYSVNAYDVNFQDSDSDTCCPLQHYTSDDPISFLSIQMSVSGNSNDNSIQTSSKSSPLKTQPYVKKTLDMSASPAKNVTLSEDNSGLITEESLKKENVFKAATDTESNDDDVVIPTPPKATTCHAIKRAKLTLRRLPAIDKSIDSKSKQDVELEGKKLALSIARDFTFDTSSNSSIGSEDTHETVNTKAIQKPKDESSKDETIQSTLPIVDKENQDSIAVNRPVRKRNCVTRAQSTKQKSKNATDAVRDETLRTSPNENVLSCPTRTASPVKRRRRRKIENADALLPKDPPSRPLRKRNSVVKDNVQQRS